MEEEGFVALCRSNALLCIIRTYNLPILGFGKCQTDMPHGCCLEKLMRFPDISKNRRMYVWERRKVGLWLAVLGWGFVLKARRCPGDTTQ